jgi:hypothetical protein
MDPNWSWYQQYPNGLDMYYSFNNQPVKINDNVQTPFFTAGNPLCKSDSYKDMYPEDGWTLVCRDFGTPSSAPENPYFILYNKYKGTLRYFFYNAQQTAYTYYKAQLSFNDISGGGAILTFNDDKAPFKSNYDKAIIESVIGKVAKFKDWYYADFYLWGYDPDLDINTRLKLEVYGVDESTLSATGKIELNQILENGQPSASSNLASNFVSAAKDGIQTYKNVDGFFNDVKKEVDKETPKEVKDRAWWYNDAADLVTSGLQDVAPAVGFLAGFISKIISTSDPVTPKPINLKGTFNFSGTITNDQLLMRSAIILNSDAPLSSEYLKPVQHINWGIFNIKDPITVYWSDFRDIFMTCGSLYSLGNLPYYYFNSNWLDLVDLKMAYTYKHRSPSSYEDPYYYYDKKFGYTPHWDANGVEDLEYCPSGVSIKLKFKVKNPTRNTSNEIDVMKVYPINYVGDWVGACGSAQTFNVPLVLTTTPTDWYFVSTKSITASCALDNRILLSCEGITLKSGFSASNWFRASVGNFNDMILKSSKIKKDNNHNFKDLRLNESSNVNFTNGKNSSNTMNEDGFLVYPSPTDGVVKIKNSLLEENSQSILEIYDSFGSFIHSVYLNNTENTIDISDKPQGVYIFKIKFNNKNFSYKIVKI